MVSSHPWPVKTTTETSSLGEHFCLPAHSPRRMLRLCLCGLWLFLQFRLKSKRMPTRELALGCSPFSSDLSQGFLEPALSITLQAIVLLHKRNPTPAPAFLHTRVSINISRLVRTFRDSNKTSAKQNQAERRAPAHLPHTCCLLEGPEGLGNCSPLSQSWSGLTSPLFLPCRPRM